MSCVENLGVTKFYTVFSVNYCLNVYTNKRGPNWRKCTLFSVEQNWRKNVAHVLLFMILSRLRSFIDNIWYPITQTGILNLPNPLIKKILVYGNFNNRCSKVAKNDEYTAGNMFFRNLKEKKKTIQALSRIYFYNFTAKTCYQNTTLHAGSISE